MDESFYHCIFGNARSLKVSPNNRRYVDWSASGRGEAGKHPKNLGIADLPSISKSGADFARKFAEDSEALEELDRFLGLPARRFWAGRPGNDAPASGPW